MVRVCAQEEVTVAMQYYQQLLGCSTGSSTGSLSSSTSAARGITADVTTKPIRDAYFTCLEDTIKTCKAAAEELRPAAAAAVAGSSSSSSRGAGSSPTKGSGKESIPVRRPGLSAAAAAAVLGQDILSDDSEYDPAAAAASTAAVSGDAAAAAGGAAAGLSFALGLPGGVLGAVLSDDVRLLLMSSNLSFMRERLVGSLTQRFLLVLTGEQLVVQQVVLYVEFWNFHLLHNQHCVLCGLETAQHPCCAAATAVSGLC
jgi:hypothetical protein